MKNINSISYLNLLWFAGLALMGTSVVFTIITGESPLEALGVSPEAGTIGTLVLMTLLAFAPSLLKKLTGQSTN